MEGVVDVVITDVNMMVKPFNPDQLLAALARVLGPQLAARAV